MKRFSLRTLIAQCPRVSTLLGACAAGGLLLCVSSVPTGLAAASVSLTAYPERFDPAINPFAKAGRLIVAGSTVCIAVSLATFALGACLFVVSVALRDNEWD